MRQNIKRCLRNSEEISGLLFRKPVIALFLLGQISQLCAVGESRPAAAARWINPCDLPGHIFDPESDMIGAPVDDGFQISKMMTDSSKILYNQARKTFHEISAIYFKDNSLVEGTASHRIAWLPKISRTECLNMSLRQACRYWYRTLQFYGVALEQMVMDEVLYGGHFLELYREAENQLTQTLCQIHLGCLMLRIRLSPDVTREVMKQEYRSGGRSTRMFRNYLIFRDYVEAIGVMTESFEGIYQRTLLQTTLQSTTPYHTQFYTPLYKKSP